MPSFFEPRQYRLASLRRVLGRVYGRHTDAVISLIGNHVPPAVLQAALQRNLLEAHARQSIIQFQGKRQLKKILEANQSASHFFQWQDHEPNPTWLGSTLIPNRTHDWRRYGQLPYFSHQGYADSEIPPTNFIVVHPLGHNTPAAGFVQFTAEGDLLKSFGRYSNCLWIQTIQKTSSESIRSEMRQTFGLDLGPESSTKKRRRMKDWAHSGMDLAEQLALELGRRYMVVDLACQTDAESDSPVHEPLLHYYGRVLLERGYRLTEIPSRKKPGQFDLQWVKDLRQFYR